MPQKPKDLIEVQQGIDPAYFSNILTKDMTTLESIFELLDNSVDAARDRLLSKRSPKLDGYGLPVSYEGFDIDLNFRKGQVELSDNCSGITESALRSRTFVVGAMSPHPYGIGRFGIGLKRALAGLGEKYLVETDTGKFAAQMRFGFADMRDYKTPLIATRLDSSGKVKNRVVISKLYDKAMTEFEMPHWKAHIVTQLSRRYGIFIGKGLRVRVNSEAVPSFGPKLRSLNKITPQTSESRVTKGVYAYIDSGMHQDYRLTYEPDYDKETIGALTDQYGWYFVCNDRIVEVAKRDPSLGWTSRWHQEYYGFVGWVRFVAEDPENLPWDTKKSRIDPYSTVFRAIVDNLQSFAEHYKKGIKKERSKQDDSPSQPKTTQAPAQHAQAQVRGKQSNASSEASKPSGPTAHNQNWTTLLPPMGVHIKSRKLSALVYEAERLDLTNCYAASMLLRAIVELALFTHINSKRKMASVVEFVLSEMEEKKRKERGKNGKSTKEDEKSGERNITARQNLMLRPTFSQALLWLSKNEAYFPDEVRRDCVFARNKFAAKLSELNGVVHENDLTNSEKLRSIREDVMPLLEFLLGVENSSA